MKTKSVLFAAFLMVALLFSGCNPSVTTPGKPDKPGVALEIENARAAAVSEAGKATVVLAWKSNSNVILGCKEKAGSLKNEVALPKGITEYIVDDLDCSTDYTFYWKDNETGEIKAELKIKTPATGSIELSEEDKETFFQERLLEYLTDEKKLEIFEQILAEKRSEETFLELLTPEEIELLQNHSLTDEEKLEIFEEIYAGKRTSAWIISQLSKEEKLEIFEEIYKEKRNSTWIISELSEEEKLEIFEQVLAKKRNDGTFLSLLTAEEIESLQDNSLTDEDKLGIFEEIYKDKRTSDWIISELTEEEKNKIIKSATVEDLKTILTDENKLAIFDQILADKRNDGTFLELLTAEEIKSLQDHSLTEEEKLEIFEEIYAGKRTSAWIISQLTDDEMEIIIGSLTAEDLRMLLEEKDKVPPAKVTDFKAIIVGDKIRLSWTDAADEDVLCYEIKYSKSVAVRSVSFDSESIIVPQGRGYAYLNDLEEDTKYSFEIRTMDTTGNKSDKAFVECTVWKQAAEPVMDISNSYYKGVLLYISEDAIPEDADVRYIIFNGNLIAQTDYNEPNEDRYKENEWGYPYVKKGNTYTFQIEYRKNGTILKEYKIEVKAKSGLGELKTIKQPAWKYENYSVLFTQQPEVTLNGSTLPDSVAYAVAQPFEPETFAYYVGIPFEGITYDAIDIAHVLENKKPEEKVTLNLRLIFPSEKYGDYIWKFFTNEQENAFLIDWENYSPYLTFDRSYDGLKFTIDPAVIPANAGIRDIYMDGSVIQRADNKELAKSPVFEYPYVEKGKSYEILISYYDENWIGISEIKQKVVASGGKGDVEILEAPKFTVNNVGVRHTEVYPKFKIGNQIISGSTIPENGLYGCEVAYGDFKWITSKSWGNLGAWNNAGDDFPEDWDMGTVIAKSAPDLVGKDLDFYFALYYEWTDFTSGTAVKYRKNFIEAKQEYFSIDWNKIPNTIWDASDAETVGVKIEYNITPDDIDISRTEGVILFVNDMPTMPIFDPSGVLEVPYVEPGKTYKIELKGMLANETFYSIGRPLTIVPKTGLLSVIQPGEFTIDSNTGVLKITKEPKLRLDDQTVESGYMYLLDVLYKGSLHSFESQEPFEGTECNIAEAIFRRDIDPTLESAETRIKLAAALELGTEDNPLYCFVQFTTDENTDGLFDVNFNWSQIPKPVVALTGEEILGIKLELNEASIPAETTEVFVRWSLEEGGSSSAKNYPASQTEIEIPNVVPGSTYKIIVEYLKQQESFKLILKEFKLTATPVKSNISFEGGSHSVDNGVLSFTKPVVKVGENVVSPRYDFRLQYRDPDFSDYIRAEYFYNLEEGNTNLLGNNWDYYKNNNITEFTYSITANEYVENEFSVVLVKEEHFTVDWSQIKGPYEIISDGSKGIKFKINEEYLPENYTGYNLRIDDIMVTSGTGNEISYPDVLPGMSYHIEVELQEMYYISSSIKFEYTPETGNVSLESPGSFTMDNGVLKMVVPPVIKRNGIEIENKGYGVLYKMRWKDTGNYSSFVNYYSFEEKVNIFRSIYENYKENYDGYAYKIYAVSVGDVSYCIPLMNVYKEESVDWDNIAKTYYDLSSSDEPGIKIKVNEMEIPEGAKYMTLHVDSYSTPVLETLITEGDNTIYYPFVFDLGKCNFSIHFNSETEHWIGNTIYGTAFVENAEEMNIESKGTASIDSDFKFKITEAPEISFPDSEHYSLFEIEFYAKTNGSGYMMGTVSIDGERDFNDWVSGEYDLSLWAVYRKTDESGGMIIAVIPYDTLHFTK